MPHAHTRGADDQPDVSIVLAVYRAEELVATVIARILASIDVDLELIVVDDGSADGTRAAAARAIAGDDRARLIGLDVNRGLGHARRVGFSAARGRYVWNVDVDDIWPLDAPARLLTAADAARADIVLASAIRRSSVGTDQPLNAPALQDAVGGVEAVRMMLAGSITGHLWNKLIATRLLDPDIYTDAVIHSDLVMVVPLLARAQRVISISDVAYVYCETPGSNIRSRKPRGDFILEAWDRVAEEVIARAPHLAASAEYRQFYARTIVLSLMRDAVRGDYSSAESSRRFADARSRIAAGDVVALARAGHGRDALLLFVAALSPRAFRRLMRRGASTAAMSAASSSGITTSGE